MEKQIYVAPLLEVLPNMCEAVLGDNSYRIFNEDEKGEFLNNESSFDNSDFPEYGSLWDEDEK